MRSGFSNFPSKRKVMCGWLASILAAGLAGCGMSMPSASSMPAFSSSTTPKARSTLGGPAAGQASHAGKTGRTLVVAEGDTLMSIGRRYDVPMSVLMEQNNLRTIALTPGTKLFIPQLQSNYKRQGSL
jgi:LysM repeat protein